MYGLIVWGSMLLVGDREKLYSAQKACIKLVGKKWKSQNMVQLHKVLYLLSLHDMIKMELCKFGYKLTNRMLPDPLLNIMNNRGGKKTHQYATRNKNIPNIQIHTSPQFHHSFLTQSITKFSRLPMDLKDIKSYKQFTGKLRKYLMDN